MASTPRTGMVVMFATALLCSCQEHSFRVILSYPDTDDFGRAAHGELFIGETFSCEQLRASDMAPDLIFTPHLVQPEVGYVAAGQASFRALLRDSDCLLFLDGCTMARIEASRDNIVEIALQPISGSSCGPDERCLDGRCLQADGGVTDGEG